MVVMSAEKMDGSLGKLLAVSMALTKAVQSAGSWVVAKDHKTAASMAAM